MRKGILIAQASMLFCAITMVHRYCIAWKNIMCHYNRETFPHNSIFRGETISLTIRHLNRILLEPEEIDTCSSAKCKTILKGNDNRTKHIYKILKAKTGESIRVGVLDAGINDEAKVQWLEKDSMQKNAIPDLKIEIDSSESLLKKKPEKEKPKVSLLLALPRPLQLERILPMISSLGVRHLILSSAQKVEKDYFGSHLFKKEKKHELRQALIDGLSQCGDTAVPEVKVVRRLKIFLEDELDVLFPRDEYVRVISHPNRLGQPPLPRMRDIPLPSNISGKDVKVLLAVGPEGGWAEPYELDLFQDHAFQGISLGERVLRSDVAVCSLLSLVHDWVNANENK